MPTDPERAIPGTVPAFLVSGGLAAVLLAGAVNAPLPGPVVAWGALALTAWCMALLCLSAASADRRGLGLADWRIGAWLLVWAALGSGLASVTWDGTQNGITAQIALGSVQRALWLTAAGMTAWAAGYCTGPFRLLRDACSRRTAVLGQRYTAQVRSPLTPWKLYALGTAGRVALLATTGRLGYVGDPAAAVASATWYGQFLSLVTLFCPLAVACAALLAWREKVPGARVTVAVLFAAEITAGAAAGGKQSFVVAVLAVLLPWTAARGRIPVAAAAAGIVVFLLVVIPFNKAYRNTVRGGTGPLAPAQALAAAPVILRGAVTSGPAQVPRSVAYLAQRMRETGAPAIVMQRTPSQIPYASPVLLATGPAAALIPRVVWPGKPVLATGYQFSEEYYGTGPGLYSSAAVTPLADLYRHGGWVPAVAGMFLLGAAVRVLDDVMDARRSPHAMLLVLLLFPGVVKGETDWATLIAGIPAMLVTWRVVVAFAFAPARSTARTTASPGMAPGGLPCDLRLGGLG